ncbi:MAG: hypothetical protein NVS9B7_18270 [Flavisolibacter sp.]
MKTLSDLIEELEKKIPDAGKTKYAISSSSVGWHVQHSLLVINVIIEAVKRSDPTLFKPRFHFLRNLIFIIGRIPRGKIKAPVSVQPLGEFDPLKIKSDFTTTKANVLQLGKLPKNSFFKHPYFQDLNVRQTFIFLKIHTQHHLHILNDILK